MIQAYCPRCGALLAFEDDEAGRFVSCPDCATRIEVPRPEDDDDDWRPPRKKRFRASEPDIVAITPEDAAVLAEVRALETQKANWGLTLALLVTSLFLYVGAGGIEKIWESLFLLIPILLFHELGHYAAMRAFGYRNLRMFFVPFFGAAVTGQHYNIAGWKKAVVALAGPLPGIALGTALAIVAPFLGMPILFEIAQLLLILNGFNLLPFSPLDGGWVVHAVLFVRHPVLDVVFRVVAALCLLGIAILAQAWCLCAVAVFMLIAAPMAYRTARIARSLGQEGLVTRSDDGQSIPDETALRILGELRKSLKVQLPAKTMAQHVASVFEAFNATPPGVLGTIIILMLHGGAFVVALVMTIFVFIMRGMP